MQKIVNRFVVSPIERLGASIIELINGMGSMTLFSLRVFYWFLKPPFRIHLLIEQIVFVGNKSIFIITLAGSFTGMVLAYQTYFGFKLINVDSLVGPVVAISLSKELAPVLTGLIVAGRAGAAMAAQIGTMRVTEQIDALEVMGINSVQYLATPRVIASIFAVPLLSIIFLLVGCTGAYIIGTTALSIDPAVFYSKVGDFMYLEDLWQGIIKSTVFGGVIALIGTFHGFEVEKGAEGVGIGTNLAVVWGMISVLILDYFLTSFLVKIL
jgi:phospholipid/cholesterol/gamma-HCH transport system permease protein